MGSLYYATSYRAVASNVSATDLATALAALPLDTATMTLVGLELVSDITTILGTGINRSLVYTAALLGQIAPDPELGQFLESQYTSGFSRALSTPVVQTPIVTMPNLNGTQLWVNAQFGAESPVAAWVDLTGQGNDLVQTSAPNQPTVNVDGAGDGVSTVDYVGATPTMLQSFEPLTYDAFTYAMTVKGRTTPGNLVERSVNATTHDGELLFQSTPTVSVRRSGVTHNANDAVDWGIDNAWHFLAFTYSPTAGGVFAVDGVQVATFAALAAESVTDTLFVGGRSGFSLGITGSMRDLMVLNRAATADELALLRASMGEQVGLTS
jgi:hypothetical protein